MITKEFRINAENARKQEGEVKFLHNKTISDSASFDKKEKATILIFIPRRLAATSITVSFFDKTKQTRIHKLNVDLKFYNLKYDKAAVKLNECGLGVGLYYFNLKIESYFNSVYCIKSGSKILFTENEVEPQFQLSVSDFLYEAPFNNYGGVIYHIFVDRFKKTRNSYNETKENFIKDWYSPLPEYPTKPGAEVKNNYFYGGTIAGIINKLDYLKSLGVTIIYLSPIFTSPSNHKYDTADYLTVDKGFGGEKALKTLIKKAHESNISIILDGVFNHTGDDSVYFNKYASYNELGAYQSENSKYSKWFTFTKFPTEYKTWWGIKILPKLNLENSECSNFFVGSGGVIEKYARLGIDGLRLDVADELSDEFIADIKRKLNKFNNSSILYGEVWEDASNKCAYGKTKEYYLGKELDGVMNYPLRRGIISYIREKSCEELLYALTDIINNAPKRIRDMQMNLLSSHDTERILTALAGESPLGLDNKTLYEKKMSLEELSIGIKRVKSAYAIISTLPGIPSIYYGDEIGMEGYSDPFNRLPFNWSNQNGELLRYYRKIGDLRSKFKVYRSGEFRLLHLDIDILAFSRYNTDDKYIYLTVYNNSSSPKIIKTTSSSLNLFNSATNTEHKINGEEALIIRVMKKDSICIDSI